MTDRELLDRLEYHRREYLRLFTQALNQGVSPVYDASVGENPLLQMVVELDEANKKLSEQVMTDSLTGIWNRRMFSQKLDELVSEAVRGRELTVMMIDIDNFKSFNDQFGHQVGDEVLCRVANTMSSQIRRADCLARYGGEEFSLATAVDRSGAEVLAEKLRHSVSEIRTPYRPITVSVGVTQFKASDTPDSLISRADLALYSAKQTGRNRVSFASF